MLLSVINMKLRDRYASLDALCEDMDVAKTEIVSALEAVGYEGNLSFEITIPGPAGIHEAGMKYLCEIGKYLISLRKGGSEA